MSTGAERQREAPNGSGASEAAPPLPRANRAVMRRFHASVPGELRIRLSQATQCETLRSGQGDVAPPLNPQLPAPLPGQRAVGAAVANRVAGALPEDHLTVMAAARTPPTRSRRPTMARRRTGTAPARAIERERSRLGQAPSGATGHGSHDGRARTPQRSAGLGGIEGGGAPLASPCRGPAKRGPKG